MITLDDAEGVRAIALAILALSVPTLVALLWIDAPYGRHLRRGWGPTLPARLGWILMESPAVFGFAALFALGSQATHPVPLTLAALWLVHYVHRTLIYPFRMRANGRRMPISVAAMAFTFQLANSYANARWLGEHGRYDTFADPLLLAGIAVFAVGLAINLHADTVLLRLRAPGERGYKIPHGGLYRWVSCPNYLGEILEWCGFALACGSLPALAFAVYTIANLAPRALANHRWYRETFGDQYPRERRALIPFVL